MSRLFNHQNLGPQIDQEVTNIYEQLANSGLNIQTTEQSVGNFLGRTLYCKAISFGVGPSAGSVSQRHGLKNFQVIFAFGYIRNGPVTYPIPLPQFTGSAQVIIQVNATVVSLNSGANYSAYNGYVILFYTKGQQQ